MTALGNTKLLERVSSGLVAIRNLFSQFDINKDNVIERDEFARVRPSCHASSTVPLQVSVKSRWVTRSMFAKDGAFLFMLHKPRLHKPRLLGFPDCAIGWLPSSVIAINATPT